MKTEKQKYTIKQAPSTQQSIRNLLDILINDPSPKLREKIVHIAINGNNPKGRKEECLKKY